MKPTLLQATFSLFVVCLFAFQSTSGQATLISQFDFNGNLNDDFLNSTASLFGNSATSYSNGALNWVADTSTQVTNSGGGLTVAIPDNLFTENNYSIAIEFKYTQTGSYRKIIDFSNRGEDPGLYVNGELRLYSAGNYGDSTLLPNTYYTLLMVRYGAFDSAAVYLVANNQLLAQSLANDQDSVFIPVLNGANREIGFFHDDTSTISEFTDSGSVRSIKIWNGIATLSNIISGISETNAPVYFNVYPNPAANNVIVDIGNNNESIIVTNLTGEIVYTDRLTAGKNIIDISSLNAGLYFIRCGNYVQKLHKL